MDSSDRATLSQLERQLQKDPGAGHLLRMAERVTRRVEAFGLLADFLANAVLVVPGPQKLDLCLKLGHLYRDDIRFPEEAARWYLQALEEAPGNQTAFADLAPICKASGQWEILVDALLLRAGAVPAEAGPLKREAALLRQENDEDITVAIHLFQEVFALLPGDPVAGQTLAEYYAETEDWEALVAVYEGLLTTATDPDDRIDLLKKLALLRETVVQDTAAATANLQQIAKLAPDDVETLKELERLYREQGNGEELADVLTRLVPHATTMAEEIALHAQLADLAEARNDVAAQLRACHEILELDPGHQETLQRTQTLLIDAGDWTGLLALLDRRIALTKEVEEVVALFLTKGDIYRDRLANAAAAEEQYRNVLELVPGQPEAMDRVTQVLLATAKYQRAMEFLLRRTRHTEDEQEQARLLTTMATIAHQHLEDSDNAVELLEAALQRHPGFLNAAEPLAELYLTNGQWARALPLLELLCEAARDQGNTPHEATLLAQIGQALVQIGRKDDAIEYYRAAYDKGNDGVSVLKALGELNLDQDNATAAATYYSGYLDRLAPEEMAHVGGGACNVMARIQRALGHHDQAREWLEKALAYAPEDTGAAADLVRAAEAQQDHAKANAHRRTLLSLQTDSVEKLATLLALGDTSRLHLNDLPGALAAYQEARELAPESKLPLMKLLELHGRAGDQAAVVEILEPLAALETDATRRVSFAYTRATLLHRELGDLEGAADAYDRVLQEDPEHIESLKALLELLTVGEAYAQLEAIYLTLLQRLENRGRRDLEHVLWRGLGELYQEHLQQPDNAVAAYQHALELKGDDGELRTVVAELHEAQADWEAAAGEYRALLQANPDSTATYRRLARVHHQNGSARETWFALSVLAALGKANDNELEWLASNRPAAPARAMTPDGWRTGLKSAPQDVELSQLFALVTKALGENLPSRSLKDLGLGKKDRIDTTLDLPFTTTLKRICTLLAVPLPEVFRTPQIDGVTVGATAPPILLVSESWLMGPDPGVLAFVLGRTLTWLHPWHILTAYLPPDHLRFVLSATLSFVRPTGDQPDLEDPDVLAIHKQLTRGLDKADETTLEQLVDDLTTTSISRWLAAVELTANHAGLLACGDIRTALAGLQQDPVSRSRMPRADQARELAVYATSKAFDSLHRA